MAPVSLANRSPSHPDVGTTISAITWTSLSLAVITVALRLFARIKTKQIGPDDICIAIALCLAIFGDSIAQLQINNGFGEPLEFVPSNEREAVIKWSALNTFRSPISILVIKLSICFFLLRVLGRTQTKLRIAIVANTAIYGLMVGIFCFALGFQIRPFKDLWESPMPKQAISKATINRISLAGNCIDCITDFVYALVPIYIIQQLQMERKAKTVLSVILGLGILTACCSIGKAVTFDEDYANFTWTGRDEQIFGTLEENVGMIVASLPALHHLLAAKFWRSFNKRRMRPAPADDAEGIEMQSRRLSRRLRLPRFNSRTILVMTDITVSSSPRTAADRPAKRWSGLSRLMGTSGE